MMSTFSVRVCNSNSSCGEAIWDDIAIVANSRTRRYFIIIIYYPFYWRV